MKRRQPVVRKSRVEVVLDYITAAIAEGTFKAGDKLPNENELSEHLGISRTPIREAMKTLAVSGIVEIKHGHGTYLTKSVGAPGLPLMLLQLHLQDSDPKMLMELRYVFDRNCAELAAERRTDADLEAMAGWIDRLRELSEDPASDIRDVLKADLGFHRAVYQAAGNRLISTVADFVLEMVSPWVMKSLEAGGRQTAVGLHEQMYAMIADQRIGALNRDSVDANMEHFRQSLERPAEDVE